MDLNAEILREILKQYQVGQFNEEQEVVFPCKEDEDVLADSRGKSK